MTFSHPTRVGSAPNEAPEVVWEILVEVEFAPELGAQEVSVLQDILWGRLDTAIRETLGPYLHGHPGLEIYDVDGRGEETPLFPVVAGEARFTCNLDVLEVMEARCRGTALQEMAFDARGRAYEMGARIEYLRRPEHDGARVAEILPADTSPERP